MTRWEYRTFRIHFPFTLTTKLSEIDAMFDRWLDSLGADGWEVYKVDQLNDQGMALCKRPKPQ